MKQKYYRTPTCPKIPLMNTPTSGNDTSLDGGKDFGKTSNQC